MDKRKIIEWHPAFEASIQIEFENEIEKMTFEPEHLLSKQPMISIKYMVIAAFISRIQSMCVKLNRKN